MKKLLAAAVFALLGTGAFAQTSQGTVVVSGGLGFSSSTIYQEDSDIKPRNTSFNISPTLGYFIKDGLEAGLRIGYSYSKNKSYSGVGWENHIINSITNTFYIGPYIRKYFMLTEKVAITGLASSSFSTGKTKVEHIFEGSNSPDRKSNSFTIGITPGVSYFPTEKIGLGATFGYFGYSYYKTKSTTNSEDTHYNTSLGLNLNSSTSTISISYFISR